MKDATDYSLLPNFERLVGKGVVSWCAIVVRRRVVDYDLRKDCIQ